MPGKKELDSTVKKFTEADMDDVAKTALRHEFLERQEKIEKAATQAALFAEGVAGGAVWQQESIMALLKISLETAVGLNALLRIEGADACFLIQKATMKDVEECMNEGALLFDPGNEEE